MSRDIIWAIDFSTQDFEKQNSVFPLAKQFAQAWGCKVQPVFVLNNKILRTDIDSYLMLQNVDIEDLEEAIFENFSLEDKSYLKNGKLLLSRSYTRRGLVKSLLEYSKEEQAQAIMCCTRTRSKYYPSFLGGFTETLLNTSTIPTISMHPELNSESPIENIMYATDLEEENDTNFKQIISVAQ